MRMDDIAVGAITILTILYCVDKLIEYIKGRSV